MCRIAYIPNPRGIEVEDLADLFSFLENAQGGDGNGLAFLNRDGTIHTIKGVSLDAEFLAHVAVQTEGPVLFHTRNAVLGSICGTLCQPFMVKNMAFAHNGVWHDWHDIALEFFMRGDLDGNMPINDSLTAAILMAKHGRYSLEAIKSGVFVIMTPNNTWLHLRHGDFEFCEEMGIYASEFPNDWPPTKAISNDSIANLLPDGPEFECGGYKKIVVYKYLAGQQLSLTTKDDLEEAAVTPKEAEQENMIWSDLYGRHINMRELSDEELEDYLERFQYGR